MKERHLDVVSNPYDATYDEEAEYEYRLPGDDPQLGEDLEAWEADYLQAIGDVVDAWMYPKVVGPVDLISIELGND